jgi:hypothetical protein
MKWSAKYSDGTSLMQYEGEKENSYLAIERDKLEGFAILSDNNELILLVSLERPTQKLIYRRRVFHKPFSSKPDEVVWLVGWHENVGGKSIKSICYIYPDGHIEMAGAKDDIELIKEEN